MIDERGIEKSGVLHNNNNKCNTPVAGRQKTLLSLKDTPGTRERADDDSATRRRWQNLTKEVIYKKNEETKIK